ncbi:MAG: hypothetical protein LBL41_02755 [Bifidobacteriaceae bacterium]|nr:hypothetical protein [Bifidobacteriaceae bacterium]
MVDVLERVSLTFDENCDRCFAPAKSRIIVGSLELYFCAQHYSLHKNALNRYVCESAEDK